MSTPGTIRDASKQAKIPVAPREKSILPEFKFVLRARAAINVIRIVLPIIIMLLKLSKGSPIMNKPTPLALDIMQAIMIITTGQNNDQNTFVPNLLDLGFFRGELLNLIGFV